MLSEQDRMQQQKDRDLLNKWWSGDHAQPFMLPRREAYDVCSVLFASPAARLRITLRCVAVLAASSIPWSQMKVFLYRCLGMKVGKGVHIAPRVVVDPMYPELIELEDGCFIGAGAKLLAHEYTAEYFRIGRVRVGTDAVIGAFSIVRSGVSVGSKATTGLGSVVLKDVSDGKIAIGNPARVVANSQWME